MKLKKISKIIITIILIAFSVAGASACRGDNMLIYRPNVSDVGVWWWHQDLGDEYFDFAVKNGITEIYWGGSTRTMNEVAKPFIQKASANKIKVYLLLGDYKWIHDDSNFHMQMDRFVSYQAGATEDEMFSGVHLDIEPQQDPSWRDMDANIQKTNRHTLRQQYIDFVVHTRDTYPDIKLDFDIPAWFVEDVSYRGETEVLYKAVILEADRVFIMSYRDTAEKMVGFSEVKQAVAYAKSRSKQIFLSAECSEEPEGNTVISFKDKGKAAMYEELNKLKDLAEYDQLGISIHHMKTWFELKN